MATAARITGGAAAMVALLLAYTSSGLAQAAPKASYVAEGSFQLPGKGQPGSPEKPAALALADDGTVHIADERGAVFVFNSSGIYQRSYGEGKLHRPAALAIAPNGEAYVLDTDLKQVLVFAPGGEPLRAVSGKGSSGGYLADPIDMALGPSGYVYVLDAGRAGVQIFSRDGVFVRDIAFGGAIREPRSLSVGNDGTIFVSDKRTPAHVYAFQPFTQLPWTETMPRGIAGHVDFRGAKFAEPDAMTVNHFGTLIVLDRKFGRLWRRNPSTERELGPNDLLYGGIGTGRGSFRKAVDVAFAGPDDVVILDASIRKVERIRLTTEEGFDGPRPDFGFPIRVTRWAHAIPAPLLDIGYGPDGEPRFLLAARNRSVTVLGSQAQPHVTVYGDEVIAYLPSPKQMRRQFARDLGEVAAAVLTDSSVVVLDSGKDRFVIFGLQSGATLGTYGDNYRDDRKLKSPRGLAVLPDGRIVISDTGNGRVKVFSADLASLVASYPLAKPAGVAVAPSGAIFAWSQDGTMVSYLAPGSDRFEGMRADLLPGPVAALTFDQAGNLFILDRQTHRVTIIKPDLSGVLMQLGAEGALDSPDRITVDRHGNIYISDPGAGRTVIYRWDVQIAPLAGLSVNYEGGAAVLTWTRGPGDFVAAYEIQGAMDSEGPYEAITRVKEPPFRIDESCLGAARPPWIRVSPVYITGTTGQPTDPYPLFNFTAAAAYQRGDYSAALSDAGRAVELINQGTLAADNEVKVELLWLAFASAFELRDYRGSIQWARQLAGMRMPHERLIQFLYRLAEVYLQLGDPREAGQHILTLVGQGPRPEYYRDPAVISQSFRIYRGMTDAGYAEDALDFVRLYAEAMPSTVGTVRGVYEDSLQVFATRTKLGPGFKYWNTASFGETVTFFERLLTTAGLSVEEHVLSRQILAAAYYAFGRRSEAEDTFREIYNVKPSFDLRSEITRVNKLYGLTIYNPETQRFFGALRPRS